MKKKKHHERAENVNFSEWKNIALCKYRWERAKKKSMSVFYAADFPILILFWLLFVRITLQLGFINCIILYGLWSKIVQWKLMGNK